MKHKYLTNVATLKLREDTCIGCGRCVQVCPHRVLALRGGKATILDLDSCMECGACARNCPIHAVEVNPGTGCVYAIMRSWINKLLRRPDVGEC